MLFYWCWSWMSIRVPPHVWQSTDKCVWETESKCPCQQTMLTRNDTCKKIMEKIACHTWEVNQVNKRQNISFFNEKTYEVIRCAIHYVTKIVRTYFRRYCSDFAFKLANKGFSASRVLSSIAAQLICWIALLDIVEIDSKKYPYFLASQFSAFCTLAIGLLYIWRDVTCARVLSIFTSFLRKIRVIGR